MKELKIPPAALKDKDAFEILRVWAAFKEQHVTIHSGLNGGPGEFGFLLAELAFHASKLYAERLKANQLDMLNEILAGFDKELNDESGSPTGGIEN
jgi:hypothetical protein